MKKTVMPSTRGFHAVTALARLTLHEAGRPLALTQIAATTDISVSYLEQLFSSLRRAGLVRSLRGPGGGYVLARPAATISVAAILLAAGGSNGDNAIEKSGPAQGLHDLIGEILHERLEQVSLKDIAAGQAAAV